MFILIFNSFLFIDTTSTSFTSYSSVGRSSIIGELAGTKNDLTADGGKLSVCGGVFMSKTTEPYICFFLDRGVCDIIDCEL